MGRADAVRPRVVCCAIPIHRPSGKVMIITSRKRPGQWVLPKGGWENGETLEQAAAREALEEAGVRGTITRYVTTFPSDQTIFHVYEMDVSSVDDQWMEGHERTREWVDLAEAYKRVQWKDELGQALLLCSINPKR
ncbi:hypothetical protein CALCODRAFT_440012 [Calocera cornea HHB12733]|uniref:Nudix hydrolase domain-containing protein n=1 Tax=Calocera cornea HHB12733 TaxID=1353952 RepID=A0A165DTC1_9BASI|nr:hypothetical protein CALCODRAFT_440012 [Calocera cornea HHB12733]